MVGMNARQLVKHPRHDGYERGRETVGREEVVVEAYDVKDP